MWILPINGLRTVGQNVWIKKIITLSFFHQDNCKTFLYFFFLLPANSPYLHVGAVGTKPLWSHILSAPLVPFLPSFHSFSATFSPVPVGAPPSVHLWPLLPPQSVSSGLSSSDFLSVKHDLSSRSFSPPCCFHVCSFASWEAEPGSTFTFLLTDV